MKAITEIDALFHDARKNEHDSMYRQGWEAAVTAMEELRSQHSCTVDPGAVTLAQQIIDRYRDNIYQDDIAEVILAREVQRLLKEREMVAFDHRMAFCALEDENKALRGSAALGMAEPDGA